MKSPHEWNKRKYATYHLLDELEEKRVLIVIPAVGENLALMDYQVAIRNYEEVRERFKASFLKSVETVVPDEEETEVSREVFERTTGTKLIPIEEILERRKHGRHKPKKV